MLRTFSGLVTVPRLQVPVTFREAPRLIAASPTIRGVGPTAIA